VINTLVSSDNSVALFARTNFRGENTTFGIRQADRRAHMYVIGKTGTGKSTLLERLIDHDVRSGQGLALIDPHGDLVERVRAGIPNERSADLIYFDVSDTVRPLAFNPLEARPASGRALAASGLVDVFKKIWADSWGPRMEHVLRNALLTLFDQPEATLPGILRLLDDYAFRRAALERVENPQVRNFWLREFAQYPDRFRGEGPVTQGVSDPLAAVFRSCFRYRPSAIGADRAPLGADRLAKERDPDRRGLARGATYHAQGGVSSPGGRHPPAGAQSA
jgi:hypothetical protein